MLTLPRGGSASSPGEGFVFYILSTARQGTRTHDHLKHKPLCRGR